MDKYKFLAKSSEQYKRFPDLNKDDVKKLMDWASKQSHFPKNISGTVKNKRFTWSIKLKISLNLTELEIILFLHSNYNRIELTKITIDNFYTCRTHMSMFFDSRDIKGSDMDNAHDTLTIVPLPKLTKEGYKVILCKLHNTDATNFVLADCLK